MTICPMKMINSLMLGLWKLTNKALVGNILKIGKLNSERGNREGDLWFLSEGVNEREEKQYVTKKTLYGWITAVVVSEGGSHCFCGLDLGFFNLFRSPLHR